MNIKKILNALKSYFSFLNHNLSITHYFSMNQTMNAAELSLTNVKLIYLNQNYFLEYIQLLIIIINVGTTSTYKKIIIIVTASLTMMYKSMIFKGLQLSRKCQHDIKYKTKSL